MSDYTRVSEPAIKILGGWQRVEDALLAHGLDFYACGDHVPRPALWPPEWHHGCGWPPEDVTPVTDWERLAAIGLDPARCLTVVQLPEDRPLLLEDAFPPPVLGPVHVADITIHSEWPPDAPRPTRRSVDCADVHFGLTEGVIATSCGLVVLPEVDVPVVLSIADWKGLLCTIDGAFSIEIPQRGLFDLTLNYEPVT